MGEESSDLIAQGIVLEEGLGMLHAGLVELVACVSGAEEGQLAATGTEANITVYLTLHSSSFVGLGS